MKALEDSAFLEALRTEVVETDILPEGVRMESDVVYGCVGERKLRLDLYDGIEPPAQPRPGMVFLHGGAWQFGSPRQFLRQAGYLAKRHHIFCVSVDYRMSEEAPFPAALQDAKCAVRWVRSRSAELRIDPEKIGIVGGSAGGHLAAMVAATPDVPEYEGDGGCSQYPSHVNLALFLNGEFDLWDLVDKGSLLGAMELFFGGSPKDIPQRYDEASPIKRLHKGMPPALFLHGDRDTCVSHAQSVRTHERLLQTGAESEIEIYRGKGHAWFNRAPDFLPVLKRMEEFIVKHFGC